MIGIIYTPSGAEIVSKSCDHFTRRVRFRPFGLTIVLNHRRGVNFDCPAFRLSRRGWAGIFQNATMQYFHEDGLSGEEREVPHCAARNRTWLEGSGGLRIQQLIWSSGPKTTHPRAISLANGTRAAGRSGRKRSEFKFPRLPDIFARWRLRAGREIRLVSPLARSCLD
jgi:hypothetical protein